MFRRQSFIAILLFSFAVSCSRTPPSAPIASATPQPLANPTPSVAKETPTGGRDLSQYAFGGRLGCTHPFPRDSPRCEKSLQQARNFIWKHWQQKTRGYVVVKRATVDAGMNAHIFIEPDERGNWRIVWREELVYAASVPNATPGSVGQLTDIRSINRKRATETDIDFRLGTPYLVFLDQTGTEVESL